MKSIRRGISLQSRITALCIAIAAAAVLIVGILQYIMVPEMLRKNAGAISHTFSIHPAYFCKLFKRTMGTTYIDYLTQCRIRKAKELLKSTDLPNYLIAEQTGFQTPEYFSKIFKRKPAFPRRITVPDNF